MYSPSPMIRRSRRCSSVACKSLGYHASGTIIVRPSARWTISSSPIADTSMARGTCSTAEEVIPSLDEFYLMFDDEPFDPPKLTISDSPGLRQLHGIEPEFRHSSVHLDVNVRRLAAIATRKEESVRSDRDYRRHAGDSLTRNELLPTRNDFIRNRLQFSRNRIELFRFRFEFSRGRIE
jgi:hypothetical protein